MPGHSKARSGMPAKDGAVLEPARVSFGFVKGGCFEGFPEVISLGLKAMTIKGYSLMKVARRSSERLLWAGPKFGRSVGA